MIQDLFKELPEKLVSEILKDLNIKFKKKKLNKCLTVLLVITKMSSYHYQHLDSINTYL